MFTGLFLPFVFVSFVGSASGSDETARFWADINGRQAIFVFGWPFAAAVLALAAWRGPGYWLAFAVVCALVFAASLFVQAVGLGNREPMLFGARVPVLSGSFYGWMSGSFLLALGGLLAWVGSRMKKSDPAT
jgi:hypothetical protein